MFTDPYTGKTILTSDKVNNNSGTLVGENKLHQFASYNYVLTLSALGRNDMEDPENIPTRAPHDIIARTGGIIDANVTSRIVEATREADILGNTIKPQRKEEAIVASQQILKQARDIYFNSVTIDSFPRPNEFRKLMNYTKIEMSLEEPNGITFWEKCKAAAFNNGYRNHTTAPFLISIEFKGFDTAGNEIQDAVPKRVYPVRLSKSSLRMSAGGTTYSVEAYPWTEFGMVNAFLYTRSGSSVVGEGKKLQNILKKLADQLNKDIEDNEQKKGLREFADSYEITADPSIGRIDGDSDNQYPVTGFLGLSVNRFSKVTYSKNHSIVKVLEDLVRQYSKYNNIEKILVDNAKKFGDGSKISEIDQYINWFKIITTVKEEPEFDRVLKTHRRTIKYHIKEFKIHILNFVKAGYGFNFDYTNAVRRVFDYTYTGKNLDILDLNVEYNAGYFQAILRKTDPTFINKVKRFFTEKVRSISGTGTFEADPLLPLSQYISTLNTENPNIQPSDETTGAIQAMADVQYDYLVNPKGDMVNVEMKIMGDPAFLGQDYAIPMKIGSETVRAKIGPNIFDAQTGAFNFDNGEVVVQLNFKFPSDFDENTGLYKFNTEATPQFTGLYRIVRVENRFENGQFTQNLTMARCNNQRRVTPGYVRNANQNNANLAGDGDPINAGGDQA